MEGGVGDGDDLVLPQAGVGGHPVPLGGDQGAVVQPLVREKAGESSGLIENDQPGSWRDRLH